MRFLKLMIVLSLSSCTNQNSLYPNEERQEERSLLNVTNVSWRDSTINLGYIKANQQYPLVFYATNVGTSPLIFQKIESTCGCTVVDKAIQKPILPNETDSIVAHFKINESRGPVERKIYVLANTQKQFYVLRIKANIVD